jgi:hypothetical protein
MRSARLRDGGFPDTLCTGTKSVDVGTTVVPPSAVMVADSTPVIIAVTVDEDVNVVEKMVVT